MAEVIDFFDKYKSSISYDEMNKLLENAVRIVIGYGKDGPTDMYITENGLVVGHACKEDAEFIVACLRDVADAIEHEANKSKGEKR